ncbi:MAG: sigma-70 family RNA polymerase sigma factor [Planctomycetota bacterium]
MAVELATLDDVGLVTQAQEGSREAFGALVERYQERVLNLVYRRLDDRELALDVAQEVFIKAYRGLSRFRADSKFYTWLFRIACNEATSAHRRRVRTRAGSLDAQSADGEKLPDPPDSRFEPGAAVERLDDQAMVRQAILELDEDLASVLLLRDIDELSYAEVAETLQIPLGSVKSRLHRARLALKTQLAQEKTAS